MKRIERAVEAFDGDLIKIGGDEMKAAFHTADAAVHAAIEMQQRIADLPPVSGVNPAIRVGISCGEGDALGSLVDDDDVKNLWAKFGRQAKTLLFVGHTDVVPTGPIDQWKFDPFTPTVEDGKLYARGTADMKVAKPRQRLFAGNGLGSVGNIAGLAAAIRTATRIAPYVGIRWARNFGRSADLARAKGRDDK